MSVILNVQSVLQPCPHTRMHAEVCLSHEQYLPLTYYYMRKDIPDLLRCSSKLRDTIPLQWSSDHNLASEQLSNCWSFSADAFLLTSLPLCRTFYAPVPCSVVGGIVAYVPNTVNMIYWKVLDRFFTKLVHNFQVGSVRLSELRILYAVQTIARNQLESCEQMYSFI